MRHEIRPKFAKRFKNFQIDDNNIALGVAFGTGIGMAFGAAIKNIALGISLGVAMGIAISCLFGRKKINH